MKTELENFSEDRAPGLYYLPLVHMTDDELRKVGFKWSEFLGFRFIEHISPLTRAESEGSES